MQFIFDAGNTQLCVSEPQVNNILSHEKKSNKLHVKSASMTTPVLHQAAFAGFLPSFPDSSSALLLMVNCELIFSLCSSLKSTLHWLPLQQCT